VSNYIVAYDITCPRRLARLHRHLVKIATPIEYSVFYLCADERQLDDLLAELVALIDPKTDDLRCYPLPERGLKARLGKATFPSGIVYTGLPAQWSEELP
jgi:CRISPR-associated endonuclease Cas2